MSYFCNPVLLQCRLLGWVLTRNRVFIQTHTGTLLFCLAAFPSRNFFPRLLCRDMLSPLDMKILFFTSKNLAYELLKIFFSEFGFNST